MSKSMTGCFTCFTDFNNLSNTKLPKLTSCFNSHGWAAFRWFHRDVRSTECPGNKLYELIETWDHFGHSKPVRPTKAL